MLHRGAKLDASVADVKGDDLVGLTPGAPWGWLRWPPRRRWANPGITPPSSRGDPAGGAEPCTEPSIRSTVVESACGPVRVVRDLARHFFEGGELDFCGTAIRCRVVKQIAR